MSGTQAVAGDSRRGVLKWWSGLCGRSRVIHLTLESKGVSSVLSGEQASWWYVCLKARNEESVSYETVCMRHLPCDVGPTNPLSGCASWHHL